MKKIITLVFFAYCSITAFAYQFTLEGEAAGKYPITIEADRNPNGSITGRYAYNSTLKRQGRDKRSSWLYIQPIGNSTTDYIITDSQDNVQERWSYADFWRNENINFFDVSVTNARGSTFSIHAHSTSKHTGTWGGSYEVYSDGYRNCPPPMSVKLTLYQSETNTYSGTWSMKIADEENAVSGMLIGDVSGKVNGDIMTLTMKSSRTVNGQYECIFGSNAEYYPYIPIESVIATLRRSGSTFTIQPQGKMKSYLNGLGGQLTIVKIK